MSGVLSLNCNQSQVVFIYIYQDIRYRVQKMRYTERETKNDLSETVKILEK